MGSGRLSVYAMVLRAALIGVAASWSGAALAGSMITGGLTSQPIGHFEFCRANPGECAIRSVDRGPQRISAALWQAIQAINVDVNQAVTPMNDIDVFGKDEVWSYPNGVGDCEDYVLEKRRLLHRRGIDYSNILITVVRKRDGEGHAVLTLRTSDGDFILDNLTDEIRTWDHTGYRFLKRQSSAHTGRWVSLRDEPNTLVGSVKK
ncbi:transglutaminase-like cysteine peptidase [Mesorhizobium xinjiangense]|uniref:transglutaminase-like cysteine peptidase n=1 Tax=Mesorhizobium xinjiangense TaxID=2678685 RepID=UPI001F4476C7|nr:transglutaminase-like cysteine peptidase [Mesorhizobium xinjiangense]